jgi:DNA end-binding protein Ku
VQFSLRQKTRLGALRVRPSTGSGHGVLMLQSLLWDDEVRDADFPSLSEDVRVSAKEADMASSLVENMGADFKPDKFSDEYQEQLRELIAAKLEQGDALDTAATFGDEDAGEAEGGQVVDLMEALRRSVAENRAKRGPSSRTDKPTPARKSTAKTTAKKTTAKKTTAKQKAPTTKAATKKSPARKSATKKTA